MFTSLLNMFLGRSLTATMATMTQSLLMGGEKPEQNWARFTKMGFPTPCQPDLNKNGSCSTEHNHDGTTRASFAYRSGGWEITSGCLSRV